MRCIVGIRRSKTRFLPHVENGTVTLIGATTENPYFEVIGALVSRSRVLQMRPLNDEDVRQILINAIAMILNEVLESVWFKLTRSAMQHLIRVAGGDARNALNALELAVESTPAGDRQDDPYHQWKWPKNRSNAGRCCMIKMAMLIMIRSQLLLNRYAALTQTQPCTG